METTDYKTYYEALINGEWVKFAEELASVKLDVDRMMELWGYQGLDPVGILKAALKRALERGTNPSKFKEDMYTLTFIASVRGVKWGTAKFKSRTTDEKREELSELCESYRVNIKGNPKATELTPQRFLILFPEVQASLLQVGTIKPVVKHPRLPDCFCFPQAPSLMDAAEWNAYGLDWLEWSVAFSRTIQGVKDVDAQDCGSVLYFDKAMEQMNFTKLSRDSTYTTRTKASARKAFLQMSGLEVKAFQNMLKAFDGQRPASKNQWENPPDALTKDVTYTTMFANFKPKI